MSDANIYEENEEQLEFAMGLIAQKNAIHLCLY